jgi:hypothetical protein
MFQVVEKHLEIISCLVATTKYVFGEVDKAMFNSFDTPCDRIVCLLADPKCEFGDVEKSMFLVVEWN